MNKYKTTLDFIQYAMDNSHIDIFIQDYFQQLLIQIQNNSEKYIIKCKELDIDTIAVISAEICCDVMINSYEYFKKQYLEPCGSNASWNTRDQHMLMTTMKLKDKTIVITGGGQGLGLTMAINFAKSGANIALIDLNEKQLQESIEQVISAGVKGIKVDYYLANVSEEEEIEKTFKQINEDFNGIDGLVNNAGILRDGMFVKAKDGVVSKKMSLQDFQSVIDVNLTGVFLCGREAAVHMIEGGKQGVIINMSSIARGGNIGQSNYAAAKAGVVAMTTTWARELGRHGIRVGAIAPGVIRTAMTDAMKPEMRDRLEKMKPVGRLGEAEEIAHTAKYIFENEFFTGRVIEIDGGLCM